MFTNKGHIGCLDVKEHNSLFFMGKEKENKFHFK